MLSKQWWLDRLAVAVFGPGKWVDAETFAEIIREEIIRDRAKVKEVEGILEAHTFPLAGSVTDRLDKIEDRIFNDPTTQEEMTEGWRRAEIANDQILPRLENLEIIVDDRLVKPGIDGDISEPTIEETPAQSDKREFVSIPLDEDTDLWRAKADQLQDRVDYLESELIKAQHEAAESYHLHQRCLPGGDAMVISREIWDEWHQKSSPVEDDKLDRAVDTDAERAITGNG